MINDGGGGWSEATPRGNSAKRGFGVLPKNVEKYDYIFFRKWPPFHPVGAKGWSRKLLFDAHISTKRWYCDRKSLRGDELPVK